MRVSNLNWTVDGGWAPADNPVEQPELVLFFGERELLEDGGRFRDLKQMFPSAIVVGCSSGGQIIGSDVSDDAVAALAFGFDRTQVRLASNYDSELDSFTRGQSLGRQLAGDGLSHIFVLADGTRSNGSGLVRGLIDVVGVKPTITGGLAGDGARFTRTLVCANDLPHDACVVAIGFYGDSLVVGHGSVGGWDQFGPKRSVTRSKGNVVFELDGEPILDLYKRYLGPEAEGLPGAGLLYPLSIYDPVTPQHRVVRTILGLSEDDKSLTFAGDVPEGFCAQLMQGRFDRLAEAAGEASRRAFAKHQQSSSDIAAIYVSCVGRRILMGQNILDEATATHAAALPHAKAIGFYSYGEICPDDETGTCELHNQTMTVTTLSERV